jgi:hypothetical protein
MLALFAVLGVMFIGGMFGLMTTDPQITGYNPELQERVDSVLILCKFFVAIPLFAFTLTALISLKSKLEVILK